MFLDEAIIDVTGGTGGRGCVSWRREKYIPKGGPDGGDGGRGGSVILVTNLNTDTLSNFASSKRFEAEKGRFGSGNNRRGRDGTDLELAVPPGTIVYSMKTDGTKGKILADLRGEGDRFIIAKGGRGGYGNAHFVSSVRQRPDFAELGDPGDQKRIMLELKLVADVGIIGYPSVGKSTLISVISAARPKIAAYPFTTLIPNLGVVLVGDRSYVVSDLPGLIEGASEGKGLGDRFLKHIERCGVLLHVLDISRALGLEGKVDIDALEKDYKTIRHELHAYSPSLSEKRELVLLNKIDLLGGEDEDIRKQLSKKGIEIFMGISAATQGNTLELTQKLLPIVLEERQKRAAVEVEEDSPMLPVLQPHLQNENMRAYQVERAVDGSVLVKGKRLEQFTRMTDFGNQGAVLRFRDVADRIGLVKAIDRLGRTEDTAVYIGDIRVEKYI
jgi:GTP-binding protein